MPFQIGPSARVARRFLPAIAALCPLLLPTSAGAQDVAAAEALFNSGVADMNAGKYETGCKAISESYRLDPRAGSLFTVATCERKWGHIATAVTRYGDYLALYDRMSDDKKAEPVQAARHKEALEMKAQLLPDVPQLTLNLPKDAPSGTVVKRDGEVLGAAALGIALPVDPGAHVVTTQAPGGPVSEQKISIEKREKKAVTLEVKPAPVTAPTTSATGREGPPPSRSYTGPIIAFGAGAAGLIAGGVFGGLAFSKQGDLAKACPNKSCPPSEAGNLHDTKIFSYASTVGFVLGGVGAAVGVVLLLLPVPGASKTAKVGARVGAGYLGFEGAF